LAAGCFEACLHDVSSAFSSYFIVERLVEPNWWFSVAKFCFPPTAFVSSIYTSILFLKRDSGANTFPCFLAGNE
jgi:hypothetical protein